MWNFADGRRRALLAGVVLLALILLASSQWFRDETATVVATFTPTATATFTPTPAPTKIPLVAPSVAAAESDNSPRSPTEQLNDTNATPLQAPVATLTGLELCWNTVDFGTHYSVIVLSGSITIGAFIEEKNSDGKVVEICSNLGGLALGNQLQVLAISKDPGYTNSESNIVTVDEVLSLILPTPANLMCKYSHVCWDKVENAESYSFDPSSLRDGPRQVLPTPEDPHICHCDPNNDPNILCQNIPRERYTEEGEESYELRIRAVADPPFQNSGYSDPLVVNAVCDSDPE